MSSFVVVAASRHTVVTAPQDRYPVVDRDLGELSGSTPPRSADWRPRDGARWYRVSVPGQATWTHHSLPASRAPVSSKCATPAGLSWSRTWAVNGSSVAAAAPGSPACQPVETGAPRQSGHQVRGPGLVHTGRCGSLGGRDCRVAGEHPDHIGASTAACPCVPSDESVPADQALPGLAHRPGRAQRTGWGSRCGTFPRPSDACVGRVGHLSRSLCKVCRGRLVNLHCISTTWPTDSCCRCRDATNFEKSANFLMKRRRVGLRAATHAGLRLQDRVRLPGEQEGFGHPSDDVTPPRAAVARRPRGGRSKEDPRTRRPRQQQTSTEISRPSGPGDTTAG